MKNHLIYLACLLIFSTGCKKSSDKNVLNAANDQELLDQYFAAATVGVISTEDDFTYILKQPLTNDVTDEVLQQVIKVSPSVKGKVSLSNQTILTFSPEKKLEPNTIYDIDINLNLLSPSVYQNAITYQIKTIEQDMQADQQGIVINDDNSISVLVIVKTADRADIDQIKSCFDPENAIIEVTEKKPMEYLLDIKYPDAAKLPKSIPFDGKNIGCDVKGSLELMSFDTKNFAIAHSDYNADEKTFQVYFTQKLNHLQDLTGLILVNKANGSYTIKNNVLTIFMSEVADKESTVVFLYSGIQSQNGSTLPTNHTFEVNLQNEKPEIEFVSDGNYFPSEGDFKIPVKSRALTKVRVVVIEIKQENVAHYLAWQSLAYSDYYNLRMYGKPVYDQVVPLNKGISDTEGWTVHGIDLSARIRKNPGSIYHISFEIAPEYTSLSCANKFAKYNINSKIPSESYFAVRDNYYNDYYEMYEDYNWEEQNDPCKLAYYVNKQPTQKMFICSDYSIIAKKAGKNYYIALNKLMDLSPVDGADITLYSLQTEKLANQKTSSDGFTTFENVTADAAVLKVEKDNHVTYLALDPNESNTLTEFDISGERSETDTEFFVYTDRDVWRPGDSIFVDLMINKNDANLPEGLPIVMTFYNVDNLIIDEQVQNIHLANQQIYSFKLSTPSSAKTGTYRCLFKIGSKSIRKNIRVETIKPNTTEIKYTFAHLSDNTIYNDKISGSLHAKFLTGFDLSNAKVKAVAKAHKIAQPFDKYKDFTFDVMDNKGVNYNFDLLESTTNDKGQASFTNNEDLKIYNSFLNVSIETETVLSGGGVNKEGKSVKVSPFKTYIGAKRSDGSGWSNNYTFTDQPSIQIVNLTDRGKPNPSNNKITYFLQQHVESWWVDKYSLRSSGNFVNAEYWKDIPAGNGSMMILGKGKISYPKGKFGRGAYKLTIRDENSGHRTQVYFTIYDGQEKIPGSEPYIVEFQTDKEEYKAGDKVKVSLPDMDGAKALISIERGNKVIQQSWHNLTKSGNIVQLNSDQSWSPNAYIHVTIIQPYKNDKNDLPLRMYGIKHLKMDGTTSPLLPVTNLLNKMESNKTYTFAVSEKEGRPMEYTIAVVDEGLLNLTGFDTPDPFQHFNGKFPLLVKTWDIYKYLIAYFKGKFAGIITIGGDDAYHPDAIAEINRFKPVVKHLGPFKISKNGKNTHSVAIPNYIGKLRLMVVACSENNFGTLEKLIPVKNPLMVQTQMPRSLNVTDRLQLPVTIQKDEPSITNANLTVKADATMLKGLSGSTPLAFAGKNVIDHSYQVEVLNKTGKLKIEMDVTGGNKSMKETTDILVNYPNSYETSVTKNIINPGKDLVYTVKPKGYSEVFEAKIMVSGLKVPNFTQYAADLIDYPYGCLEQTTSSGFAQLYLDKILTLTPNENKLRLENLNIAVNRIAKYQQPSGKFNYWDGNYYHAWSDVYAGNFLVEMAKLNLLPKNADILRKWLDANTAAANNWALAEVSNDYTYESETIAQAFRLFVLAKAGYPAKSAMNRFVSSSKSKNPLTWWLLAGSFQLSGYDSKAKEYITKAESLQISNAQSSDYDTFGDQGRDMAIVVEVLSYFGSEKPKFEKYYDQMVETLNKMSWASTQTKGFAFIGAYKYFGKAVNANSKVEYTVAGLTGGQKTFSHTISEPKVIAIAKSDFGKSITIQNKGKGNIFVYQTERFIDNNVVKPAAASNLGIKVDYYNSTKKQAGISSMKLGDDVVINITVSNPSALEVNDLALNLNMPSGWELLNPRLYETSTSNDTQQFDYQDFRDDRVYTFFGLKPGGRQTFTFKAKAGFTGDFYLPSVSCENMYDGNMYAKTATGRVNISR